MVLPWGPKADGLFADYVDEEGNVDYGALRDDPRLGETADAIADQDPDAFDSPAEEKAFWINAYNVAALVLVARMVRRKGRVPARGLRGLWAKFRFFLWGRVRVAGRRRTLFGLEHLTIRRKYDDPRIHFALVCASESCPPLKGSLFHAETLNDELDRAAHAFVRPGVAYAIDRRRGTVTANRIFKWYRRDFRAVGGIVGAIAHWGPQEDAEWVETHDPAVRYKRYDWSLNATS